LHQRKQNLKRLITTVNVVFKHAHTYKINVALLAVTWRYRRGGKCGRRLVAEEGGHLLLVRMDLSIKPLNGPACNACRTSRVNTESVKIAVINTDSVNTIEIFRLADFHD
jgi:hypothetical protein